MARKAKYSEEWRSRAAALQTEIEEAMTLATSSIGDYSWFMYRTLRKHFI